MILSTVEEEDENIIEICEYKLVQKISQDSVDVLLKDAECVREFKRDNQSFKQIITCTKDRESFVFFSDSDLMKDRYDVQFRESFCLVDAFQCFVY